MGNSKIAVEQAGFTLAPCELEGNMCSLGSVAFTSEFFPQTISAKVSNVWLQRLHKDVFGIKPFTALTSTFNL